MWKTLKFLALIAIPLVVYGGFTYYQSTRSGPFAFFIDKHPNLKMKKLLSVANEEISEFSNENKSIDIISHYMQNLGFERTIYQGEELVNRTWGNSVIAEYLFSYRYGVLKKTHVWVYTVLINQDNTLSMGRSVQVCRVCP